MSRKTHVRRFVRRNVVAISHLSPRRLPIVRFSTPFICHDHLWRSCLFVRRHSFDLVTCSSFRYTRCSESWKESRARKSPTLRASLHLEHGTELSFAASHRISWTVSFRPNSRLRRDTLCCLHSVQAFTRLLADNVEPDSIVWADLRNWLDLRA